VACEASGKLRWRFDRGIFFIFYFIKIKKTKFFLFVFWVKTRGFDWRRLTLRFLSDWYKAVVFCEGGMLCVCAYVLVI
jgi:hypothetical protein